MVKPKIALVAPGGTTTVFGTTAAKLLLTSLIWSPVDGAALSIVTVPVESLPPVTIVGSRFRPVIVVALTVRLARALDPAILALTRAIVVADTGFVEPVNAAVVAPGARFTEVGPAHADELEERPTTIPWDGAGPLRLTCPFVVWPPISVVGANSNDVSFGASIVKVAPAEADAFDPLIVATVLTETGWVLIEKVALFAPPGMVIDDGRVAAELDEVRDTVKPVGPALSDRLTAPVELLPPTTFVGDNDTVVILWA